MACDTGPPEPILSDYVELTILLVFFIVGGPLNLAAWAQLNEKPLTTRLDLLKRHLNYSDLLVMFIYTPSRICWLITYAWRGGNNLCKIIKYLHTFTFQGSANVIICIALDRLFSVLCRGRSTPERRVKQTRIMIVIAWIIAAIISLPQLLVWKVFQPFTNYSQCSNIWQIEQWENQQHAFQQCMTNASSVEEALNGTANLTVDVAVSSLQQLYNIGNLMLVFWVPFVVITLSYAIIICYIFQPTKMYKAPNVGGSLRISFKYINNKLNVDQYTGRTNETAVNSVRTARCTTAENDVKTGSVTFPQIVVCDENEQCVPLSEQETELPTTIPVSAAALPSSSTPLVNSSGSDPHSSVTTLQLKGRGAEVIRVSFFLVAAYIVCWLPYNGMMLWQLIDPEHFVNMSDKTYFLHEVIIFNSLVNPFLYGMFANFRNIRRDCD